MCIVTACNRSLFGAINLFHKFGLRWLNLNFAKFFLHNGLNNIFLDLIVYLLIGFSLKIDGVSIFTKIQKAECLKYVNFMHCHCINLFKWWFCRSEFVFEIYDPCCMFLMAVERLQFTIVYTGPCYICVI